MKKHPCLDCGNLCSGLRCMNCVSSTRIGNFFASKDYIGKQYLNPCIDCGVLCQGTRCKPCFDASGIRSTFDHSNSGANPRHGHALGGGRGSGGDSPTYTSWQAMKNRCLNPNAKNFSYYGGRGIEIYKPWIEDFVNFLTDLGERPLGTTLDRIDPNGNYEPGNVRWATPKRQRHNRRPK